MKGAAAIAAGAALLGGLALFARSKSRSGGASPGPDAWNPADSVGEGNLTELPPSVARELISAAVKAAGGTARHAAMLTAQSDVETATWQRMREWNFGGITVLPGGGKYFVRQDGGVTNHFQVSETPDKGAAAFAAFIRGRPALWYAAGTGDPDIYAIALGEAHYFTSPVSDYAEALKSRVPKEASS